MIYFALCFLMVLAAGSIGWTTRWGIGTEADSYTYFSSAQAMIDSRYHLLFHPAQLIQALQNFPPGYPFLMSLTHLVSADLYEASRILNILLFMLLIGLVVWMTSTWTRSWRTALITGMFVLLAGDLIEDASMAWSETLFMVVSLLAFYPFGFYLKTKRLRFLMMASLFVSLACLTRYIGVIWIMMGCFILLGDHPRGFEQRLKETALFGALGGLPITVWLIFKWEFNHTIGGRHFRFHPHLTSQACASLRESLSTWIFGNPLQDERQSFIYALFIAGGVAILLGWGFYTLKKHNIRDPLISMLVCAMGCYVGFILFAHAFWEADLFWDSRRILSPLHVLFILTTALVSHRMASATAGRVLKNGIGFLLISLMVVQGYQHFGTLNDRHRDGQGYSSPIWRASPTISFIKNLPADQLIYTNDPWAVYFLCHRNVKIIPIEKALGTFEFNTAYEAELAQMKNALKNRNGLMIYFDNKPDMLIASEQELIKKLNLHSLLNTSDGHVLAV